MFFQNFRDIGGLIYNVDHLRMHDLHDPSTTAVHQTRLEKCQHECDVILQSSPDTTRRTYEPYTLCPMIATQNPTSCPPMPPSDYAVCIAGSPLQKSFSAPTSRFWLLDLSPPSGRCHSSCNRSRSPPDLSRLRFASPDAACFPGCRSTPPNLRYLDCRT